MTRRLCACGAISIRSCVSGVIVHLCVFMRSVRLVSSSPEGSAAAAAAAVAAGAGSPLVFSLIMSSQSALCPLKEASIVSVTVSL